MSINHFLALPSLVTCSPCIHGGDVWLHSRGQLPIDFSSNTNPLGPSPKALKALRRATRYVHLYPDPKATKLRESIAQLHDISANSIAVCAGITEILYLLAKIFIKPGDLASSIAPTYGEYEAAVLSEGGRFEYVLLNGFELPIAPLAEKSEKAKLIFICNPNNPTGTSFKREDLLKLLFELEGRAILVVDESYIDFTRLGERAHSLIRDAPEMPNLVVLRSFSKSHGLAGLRVGYLAAHPQLIEILERVKPPWSVSVLAEQAALAALEDQEHVQQGRRIVFKEKPRLQKLLASKCRLHPYPSDANFLLVKIRRKDLSSAALKQLLLQRNILIRDCSSFQSLGASHIRIAIKTRSLNNMLLKALVEVL
ncbi:MAG: histidinol-phosphate transaminase [Candidatus Verstraetearchaeota archaeon]|nr:histidinol-phosphate transaminase [Candidatus Verstraetearchaeota archaeon]